MKEKSVTEIEVWVTGIGIVSALGAGKKAHLDAILQNRSGLDKHNFFNGKSPDPVVCGLIPYECLPFSIEESAANRANLILDTALKGAKQQALLGSHCIGDIIIGTTQGNMHGGTTYYEQLKKGIKGNVGLVRDFLLNSPADYIANKNLIHGKCLTVSSACASGLFAIGKAYQRIKYGLSERIFAGGVDALSPYIVAGFHTLGIVSKKICRPFDVSRDGLNPGEGAGMLVLERSDIAQKRGIKPHVKISGFGEALEGYHQTRSHPEGKGISKAILKALNNAKTSKESIDHIHLHGTATQFNDISEYNGLKTIFGKRVKEIPVCSTKSMTGHTFGGSGAISTVLSIISLNENIIPPTLFHKNLDPFFEDLNVSGNIMSLSSMDYVLITSLGFGGEVAVIIIENAT